MNNSMQFLKYSSNRHAYWVKHYSSTSHSPRSLYSKAIANNYKKLIPDGSSILEVGCGRGDLMSSLNPNLAVGIDFCEELIEEAKNKHPQFLFYCTDAHDITVPMQKFDYIVLSDLLGEVFDIQRTLMSLSKYCRSDTRIILNYQSQLWSPFLIAIRYLRFANPCIPKNWLTHFDVKSFLELSQFEVIRRSPEILTPDGIPFISTLFNRFIARMFFFKHFCLTNFVVARPKAMNPPEVNPSLSIIVPARNEAGHIRELLDRIPSFDCIVEVIFVEGNSSDNTYEVIENEIKVVRNFDVKLFKQSGKGKGDAVRKGFTEASGDILIILDADITVPPEFLPRFYAPLKSGLADFVNGVRLVYPMDDNAMRFLNLIGNKFFSAAFTWLLGQPIRDTLCGTKALWKRDYLRILKNREYFGDFDPFGDFDLIFGASKLNLKIVEVPIRYAARVYGETNISRWSHGWLLLKMVIFASKKIKFA
jgi:2-polyprenyl-3-methyl-5-hydroxy-6-metoxy-1,4-benzoquinol methylase